MPPRALATLCRLSVAMFLPLTLVASGCGNGSDNTGASQASQPPQAEAETIKTLFRELQAAYIAGDGRTVCALLTKGGQKSLMTFGAQDSCEKSVKTLSSGARDSGIKQQPARVLSVQIDNDNAVAKISDGGGKALYDSKLVREEGQWKLVSAIGGTPSN